MNINKEYKKFNIPEEKIPSYNNDPNEFINQYKKCSLRKYVNITYSNSSEKELKDLSKKK